jgi:alkylhydroperoxidase family enzyme
MRHSADSLLDKNYLTSYFLSDDKMRSRSVSNSILASTLDLAALPARLVADCEREIHGHLKLEAGDVETLSLARARMRWPDYSQYFNAMALWTKQVGLGHLLSESDVALMACRGAKYHHDGEQYGSAAFCNLFLSEDKGLDLHFPLAGKRFALSRGTAVIFDTCQPHAVIRRDKHGFDAADFPVNVDNALLFLSWEFDIENAQVAHALQIAFDTSASTAVTLPKEQVWLNGKRMTISSNSGDVQILP